MANEKKIEGSSVGRTETRFTLDPPKVKPWPDLVDAKDWLKQEIGKVIDTDVAGTNPLDKDGISVSLRMYSARGRKPC